MERNGKAVKHGSGEVRPSQAESGLDRQEW